MWPNLGSLFRFGGASLATPAPVLALPAPAAPAGSLIITRSEVPEGASRNGGVAPPPQNDYKDLPLSQLAHWTVPNIRTALDQHQVGMFAPAALLTESLLGDGRVQTALNGRLKGITMRHPHAEPAPGDRGGKYAKLCLRLWGDILHDELMDQVWMWSVLMGFNICEIRWEQRIIDGDALWFPVLNPWHPFYLYYQVVDRQYIAITGDEPVAIRESDPKWWVMTPWGSYRGWLRGALRSVAPNWAVRQYALRDWARFSEQHGQPLKVLRPPAQANAIDKSNMLNQVSNIGSSTTLMLPQQTGPDGASWLLELLEAKDRAWEAFPGLLEHCDREIQQVIRGTNLTSEVQGGSYAAAQVHADEDSGYADSDARKLCASVAHVFRLFLRFNFGVEAEQCCPRFRLEPPDKADLLALAQSQQFALTMAAAAKEQGWQIDVAKLAERYAIPLISSKVLEPEPEGPVDADGDAPEETARGPRLRLRPRAGDFKESDHPRRDDGKFGSGGGSDGGNADKGSDGGEKKPEKSDRQKNRETKRAREKELGAAIGAKGSEAKTIVRETKKESKELLGDRDAIHEIMVTSVGQPARDSGDLGDLIVEKPEKFPTDALELMMRDADKLSDELGEPRLTGEKRERLEQIFRRNIDAHAEQLEWVEQIREKYSDVI